MKNLLHLGEDRYLTTLLLKHHQKYKTNTSSMPMPGLSLLIRGVCLCHNVVDGLIQLFTT